MRKKAAKHSPPPTQRKQYLPPPPPPLPPPPQQQQRKQSPLSPKKIGQLSPSQQLENQPKISDLERIISDLVNQNRSLQNLVDSYKTNQIRPKELSDCLIDSSHYQKIKKVGRGRFGKVLLIKSPKTGEVFAKKVFEAKMTEENAKKFMRECEIAAQIDHPCVIKFVGFSMQSQSGYATILFEYADKGTLQDILDSKPAVWTETRKSICILEIAFGMKYLHENKIIHRDLKPSNILCTGNYHFKISDFSESTFSDIDYTMTSQVGTNSYMSPEIIGGESSYNESTDVFSFGVILFYILTGSLPKVPLRSFLTGKRASIPSSVTQFMRELISRCWQDSCISRPTFEDIIRILETNSFKVSEDVDEFLVRDRYDELSRYN